MTTAGYHQVNCGRTISDNVTTSLNSRWWRCAHCHVNLGGLAVIGDCRAPGELNMAIYTRLEDRPNLSSCRRPVIVKHSPADLFNPSLNRIHSKGYIYDIRGYFLCKFTRPRKPGRRSCCNNLDRDYKRLMLGQFIIHVNSIYYGWWHCRIFCVNLYSDSGWPYWFFYIYII